MPNGKMKAPELAEAFKEPTNLGLDVLRLRAR
jgi:hypothetical protein